MRSLPPLPGSGGGLPMQFVISTTQDYQVLAQVAEELEKRARASGLFSFVDLDLRFENPTVVLTVDRDKAGAYGISMADLGTEWLTMVSNGYINRMSVQGRSYRVIPQVARVDRLRQRFDCLLEQLPRLDVPRIAESRCIEGHDEQGGRPPADTVRQLKYQGHQPCEWGETGKVCCHGRDVLREYGARSCSGPSTDGHYRKPRVHHEEHTSGN